MPGFLCSKPKFYNHPHTPTELELHCTFSKFNGVNVRQITWLCCNIIRIIYISNRVNFKTLLLLMNTPFASALHIILFFALCLRVFLVFYGHVYMFNFIVETNCHFILRGHNVVLHVAVIQFAIRKTIFLLNH